MTTGRNNYPSLFATQPVLLARQTNREPARRMRAPAAVIHAQNMPRGAASRLSEIERRLEAIRKHIPRYSSELTTLGLLIIHVEKPQNDLCNAVLKAYDQYHTDLRFAFEAKADRAE